MISLFQAVRDCRVAVSASADGGVCEAVFVFPPEFPGFAGHFPDNPVLPGIAQIMAVVHTCEADVPPSLRGIKTCKFLRPVVPGERVTVRSTRGHAVDTVAITATLDVDGAPCASMTLFVAESTR